MWTKHTDIVSLPPVGAGDRNLQDGLGDFCLQLVDVPPSHCSLQWVVPEADRKAWEDVSWMGIISLCGNVNVPACWSSQHRSLNRESERECINWNTFLTKKVPFLRYFFPRKEGKKKGKKLTEEISNLF